MGTCFTTCTQATTPTLYDKPLVRMCSSGNHFPTFADIGDTVVLFVDFGDNFKPVPRRNLEQSPGGTTAGRAWPDRSHMEPEQYEIKLAGLQTFLQKLRPKDEGCRSFRAEARILMTDEVLEDPGGLVKFVIPYSNNDGQHMGDVTETDKEYDSKHRVHHYPLWDELIGHNQDIREEIRHRTSPRLVDTTYGSMGHQRHSLLEKARDYVDAATASTSAEHLTSDEHAQLLQNQTHRAERYWPDTWEMSWWRRACCDPIMRSQNCFTRFWAMFFVAPLTNVTGLSLYYQLYLTEIFHLNFKTKFGHYFCMPLIVMMMMTFFAQWTFGGTCYTLANTDVLVLNGAAVMAYVFLLWYTIWGLIQKTPCMGLFMVLPMGVLYILANITFQMAVKNSLEDGMNCTKCWNHTDYSPHLKYFNAFKLMRWYYNPTLWVMVLCFTQALSHMFEPKIPPRVSQTAHWMSCSQMFKAYGYRKSFVIFLAQALFGTIDELLASPRLLPLLMLRICFNLGYHPKEWEVLQILVKKSLEYGDPALDFIGTGGAEYLPEDSVIPATSLSDIGADKPSVEHAENIGYNIGKLKRHLQEMDSTLTAEQKEKLNDPRKLLPTRDDWLQHYIVVRHYIAKYELQVHAYGPFRTREQGHEAERDDRRMQRDFPMKKHASFRNFLCEVRFYLWMMEDNIIERRTLSACCAKEL